MNAEGWRLVVEQAIRDNEAGDSTLIDLLVELLVEQDAAKQRLREFGFGVTGTPWPRIVDEIEPHRMM